MGYLIDTCVFAEYAKPRQNKAITGWVDALPYESVFVSVLTVGEIEKGILRMEHSRRKTSLAAFLEDLIARLGDHVLDVRTSTVRRWAELLAELERRGRPLPIIDSLLAATALEHSLTIVTRNVNDFSPTGVKVLDLWK